MAGNRHIPVWNDHKVLLRRSLLPRFFPYTAPFAVLLASASGCLKEDSRTTLVPDNPFKTTSMTRPSAGPPVMPAATETAVRVDSLGRKIVAANPQASLKPLFHTMGVSQPEIFHRGTSDLYITEGLVKQCKTEGELAAVLCYELGKMVSEREAQSEPTIREPQRRPPMEVRVGGDGPGLYGTPDQTRLAEMADYDKVRQQQQAAVPPAPPDPTNLARNYLKKAGYAATDLEAVTPALQAASANMTYEKQMAPRTPGKVQAN